MTSYAILMSLILALPTCATKELIKKKLITLPTPEAVFPDHFDPQKNLKGDNLSFLISGDLVQSYLIKPSALGLRIGPSEAFPLKDQVLKKNQQVLELARSGPFRKILSPATQATGWTHEGMLKPLQALQSPVRVDPRLLAKVFAKRPIEKIFNYTDQKPVSVKIPKGSGFFQLRRDQDKTLIFISQTGSLYWIDNKDLL